MYKLQLVNEKMEWTLITVLSLIALYFQFKEINFIVALMMLTFDSIHAKCKNKKIYINKNYEIFKIINYICLSIFIIWYLVISIVSVNLKSQNYDEQYLMYGLFIFLIIHSIGIIYRKYNKHKYESFTFFTNSIQIQNLIYYSLYLNIIFLAGGFFIYLHYKLIILFFHFLLIRKLNSEFFSVYLFIITILLILTSNFISVIIMYFVYYNNRVKNIKTVQEEINEIMSRDVSI